MRYVSTKNPGGASFGLAEGLRLGPAPDGGLFVPTNLRELDDTFWRDHAGRSLSDTALAVMTALIGDALPVGELRHLLDDALDFPMPLRAVTHRISLLELFHGPTLAFKDVGARFMARLMARWAGSESAAADGAHRHLRRHRRRRGPGVRRSRRRRAWRCSIPAAR